MLSQPTEQPTKVSAVSKECSKSPLWLSGNYTVNV